MFKKKAEIFRIFSHKVSGWAGSPLAFILALISVLIWLGLGPYFEWSDSHSLFINTFSTCVTYLLLFIVQNTQNRNDKEVQLKLAEIIRALGKARNAFIKLEDLSDAELKKMENDIKKACERRAKR